MTAADRKALAEQIVANPLFADVLGKLESAAIETLIAASTESARIDAQAYVRAARTFRRDLELALSTREPKAAPV